MKTLQRDKVLPDKILDDKRQICQNPTVRTFGHTDYLQALPAKIYEESGEFEPASPDPAQELADTVEIIDTFTSELGITVEARQKIPINRRRKKRGV